MAEPKVQNNSRKKGGTIMNYKKAWNKLKETIEEVETLNGRSQEWLNVISIPDLKNAMEIIESEVQNETNE